MNRRGFLFAGFAAAIGALMAPSVASASGIGAAGPRLPETLPLGRDGITENDLLVPAQAGPPRGRRRRRRCRVVQRRVAYRDRSGRIRYRMVSREICN